MQEKWCIRCSMSGHLSHACPKPNPLNFTAYEAVAVMKHTCTTCLHSAKDMTQHPCNTCRPLGTPLGPRNDYKSWEPRNPWS